MNLGLVFHIEIMCHPWESHKGTFCFPNKKSQFSSQASFDCTQKDNRKESVSFCHDEICIILPLVRLHQILRMLYLRLCFRKAWSQTGIKILQEHIIWTTVFRIYKISRVIFLYNFEVNQACRKLIE